MLNHVLGAEEQVFFGDVLLHRVGVAVKTMLPVSGKVEHRLAQRFAGNGAQVDADTAHHPFAFRNGNLLAQLRRLNGRVVPRRP